MAFYRESEVALIDRELNSCLTSLFASLKWEVNDAARKVALSGLRLIGALFPLLVSLQEFLVPSKKLR
jgi:hypothetical protein